MPMSHFAKIILKFGHSFLENVRELKRFHPCPGVVVTFF